jgi:LytS/YehU family sensor histidine kinase
MLYECKEQEVSIDQELRMLRKYVELEKLRYGNRLDVAFTVDGDTTGLAIAPLVLLPFVENSFKHGVSGQIDQCWISVHVHIEGRQFTLQVSNSRVEQAENTVGGIGMENVRKRLKLLYPETHELKITAESEVYVVRLELTLNNIVSQKYVYAPQTSKEYNPSTLYENAMLVDRR